jgi:NitT/TauT family transport system ATP-binding protein
VLEVGIERPRWQAEVRGSATFLELRSYLWNRIRDLVLNDPQSDFYGRDHGGDARRTSTGRFVRKEE